MMDKRQSSGDSGEHTPRRGPSVLKSAEVNGAPGWLLDGTPYVPIMAQAGGNALGEIRDGVLRLMPGVLVRVAAPPGLGESFAVACTLTCNDPVSPHACCDVLIEGRTAEARLKRYSIVLGRTEASLCTAHSQQMTPKGPGPIHGRVGRERGGPVRLCLTKRGAVLRLDADGVSLGEWIDPDPMAGLVQVILADHDADALAGQRRREVGKPDRRKKAERRYIVAPQRDGRL